MTKFIHLQVCLSDWTRSTEAQSRSQAESQFSVFFFCDELWSLWRSLGCEGVWASQRGNEILGPDLRGIGKTACLEWGPLLRCWLLCVRSAAPPIGMRPVPTQQPDRRFERALRVIHQFLEFIFAQVNKVNWSMDRDAATVVRAVREEKESEEKETVERRSEERRSIKAREKVEKSRNTVFLQCSVAPEGRKIGSIKRRVRSHIWSYERWKIACRCGTKHVWKRKC